MTTNQKLQAITVDIREKLPSLMELSKGCIIEKENIQSKIYYKNDYGLYSIEGHNCLFELPKTYIEKYFKIIGHEPMINDVLEWYNKFNSYDIHFLDKAFVQRIIKIDPDYDEGFKIDWDLSKPYLKDQSPELINFLYNLKEKK